MLPATLHPLNKNKGESMSNHHVKLFIEDGTVVYIHHNVDKPDDDDPGKHASGMTGEKLSFVSRDDGPFTIEFKAESPFVSGVGSPGNKIKSFRSGNVDKTNLELLKDISPVNKKTFPYTATLAGIPNDPEIIIDNSGGTGGGKKKVKKKKKK
jgi:hypothetical protein